MSRARLLRTFADEPAEVHALIIGFQNGLTCRPWWVAPRERPENEDVQAEPHYYDGGHVAGALTQVTLIVLLCVVGYHAGVFR